MLPQPSFTLTIPSIHDGTPLECRIYHPASFSRTSQPEPWKQHAAVFAHPYAPLGGSFDDGIVDIVAAQLLHKGYLLGTFNFRGAGQSGGRTSWTARPERDDYISFVGFMAHYVHRLVSSADIDETRLTAWSQHPSVLLMAGYSYGAMVTTQLPPLNELLEPFSSPDSGSHAAQIRLRAEGWAEKQRHALREAQSQHQTADSPRSSASPGLLVPANGRLSPINGFMMPRPAYLLVSPLQGLVTHLATMSLMPSVLTRRRPPQQDTGAEAKLVQSPTLAVFGDCDIFVPVGKLRAWVARLSSQPASQFRGHEIPSAGHFWAEEGVLHSMLDLVCDFAYTLYDSN
ncbi:hypothetical protein BBK36DRAFT_1120212 [Trichoderma citrinoviride]|uniref:AB hydrolase-1 domain-containing protein n=1 Tax=Trichoderma citrinoviride TaxID=58853 RepID=A0A2T4B945_9HYPO|nr:hypothetical protein BBK36DRAFT_1120212 [Trichoderma citrinoviride]PTB65844.1 hypothetical protein BBK36DRAFT_1120212 [Trichoderma citrinoviride]